MIAFKVILFRGSNNWEIRAMGQGSPWRTFQIPKWLMISVVLGRLMVDPSKTAKRYLRHVFGWELALKHVIKQMINEHNIRDEWIV